MNQKASEINFGPSLKLLGSDMYIPIVPITAVVYTKLKAGRQKDIADIVELLKRGKIDIVAMDRHLGKHAPGQLSKWQQVKRIAVREE